MPDSIFFTKEDAIHGYTDTPFAIAAVSHGCVRLPRRDVAALFQLVKQEGMAKHPAEANCCATQQIYAKG
jgi:hypothetical protein